MEKEQKELEWIGINTTGMSPSEIHLMYEKAKQIVSFEIDETYQKIRKLQEEIEEEKERLKELKGEVC